MAQKRVSIVNGPGRWQLLQSAMRILDAQATTCHVAFTLDVEGKKKRSGRITGLRDSSGESTKTYLFQNLGIEGYFFQGSSPYKEHGIPFTGAYDPNEKTGWLLIDE